MYVACPSCKSLYSITEPQLAAAGGQVRCSQCRTLFNAAGAVFDTPREALAYEYPLQQELVREIDQLVDRALDGVTGVDDVPGPQTADADAPETGDGEYGREAGDEIPVDDDTDAGIEPLMQAVMRVDTDRYAQPVAAEFVPPEASDDPFGLPEGLLLHDPVPAGGRISWGAIAAALFMTLALVAQYAWWDRNRLAQINALRPALEWACHPLDCRLPLRHDLTRVEMVEREVRDHPNVKDALLVSAAFINRADFPQAYPVLQIAFSDISGTPIAVRRFRPEEYLHGKNPGIGMAPGEQTLVMLEVVDPGERAVSFQFDFM